MGDDKRRRIEWGGERDKNVCHISRMRGQKGNCEHWWWETYNGEEIGVGSLCN